MIELVFATHNKNKLKEVEAILPDSYLLLNLDDIGCHEELKETENTFAGNALMKAAYVAGNYACNCFADDSGLVVEALNGEPGVFSARYAGEQADSGQNIDKLLRELNGVGNRKARFVTVIALILEGKEYYFEGSIDGYITTERLGAGGFGYDPVFIPEGHELSFAQMGAEEKNRISHRYRAIENMNAFLAERSLRP